MVPNAPTVASLCHPTISCDAIAHRGVPACTGPRNHLFFGLPFTACLTPIPSRSPPPAAVCHLHTIPTDCGGRTRAGHIPPALSSLGTAPGAHRHPPPPRHEYRWMGQDDRRGGKGRLAVFSLTLTGMICAGCPSGSSLLGTLPAYLHMPGCLLPHILYCAATVGAMGSSAAHSRPFAWRACPNMRLPPPPPVVASSPTLVTPSPRRFVNKRAAGPRHHAHTQRPHRAFCISRPSSRTPLRAVPTTTRPGGRARFAAHTLAPWRRLQAAGLPRCLPFGLALILLGAERCTYHHALRWTATLPLPDMPSGDIPWGDANGTIPYRYDGCYTGPRSHKL